MILRFINILLQHIFLYCITLFSLTIIAAYQRLRKRFEHRESLSLSFLCAAGMMFLLAVLIQFVKPNVQDKKDPAIDNIKQERVLPENIV